jgi:hypothetical protein
VISACPPRPPRTNVRRARREFTLAVTDSNSRAHGRLAATNDRCKDTRFRTATLAPARSAQTESERHAPRPARSCPSSSAPEATVLPSLAPAFLSEQERGRYQDDAGVASTSWRRVRLVAGAGSRLRDETRVERSRDPGGRDVIAFPALRSPATSASSRPSARLCIRTRRGRGGDELTHDWRVSSAPR